MSSCKRKKICLELPIEFFLELPIDVFKPQLQYSHLAASVNCSGTDLVHVCTAVRLADVYTNTLCYNCRCLRMHMSRTG